MRDRVKLDSVLARPRAASQAVCLDGDTQVSWRELLTMVRQWHLRLKDHPGQTFGLYSEDTLNFVAALLALWNNNRTALLPGDCLPATLDSIRPLVDDLVGDFPTATGALQPDVTGTAPVPAFDRLDPDLTAVVVFTSGSTGAPQQVPFRLSQLDTELGIHESLWGQQIGDALLTGTVSHQHIYGLLFRALWPLSAGRPFTRRSYPFFEELIGATRNWPALAIVTTPSHLSRLPSAINRDTPGRRCRAVFSSTAPLQRSDSLAAGDKFGTPITEIFGSSETSGIAWRRQANGDTWEAFPGIQIRSTSAENALQINSPIIPDAGWYTTSDRIEIVDDRHFKLLGRLDQVAKIEGKRVSLAAMERAILAHQWIAEVKAIALQGKRSEIGIVARLTAAGAASLASPGKSSMVQTLRQLLSGEFERPVIPRRWRFVDSLPANAQGKATHATLSPLFVKSKANSGTPSDGKACGRRRHPEVVSCEHSGELQVDLQLRIDPDIAFFDGHFPEALVLPGVVQIHWAEYFARRHLGQQFREYPVFHHLEAIKFHQVITPNRCISLQLQAKSPDKLQFRYFEDDIKYSSGRIVFAPAAGTP